MDRFNITLNLTVAQINVILKYLGGGAFAEVENVVNAIRVQATPQLSEAQGNEPQVFEEKSE